MKDGDIRKVIEVWVKNLKSGNGDYKRVYVEDYLELLIALDVENVADRELLKNLNDLTKKLSWNSPEIDEGNCQKKWSEV